MPDFFIIVPLTIICLCATNSLASWYDDTKQLLKSKESNLLSTKLTNLSNVLDLDFIEYIIEPLKDCSEILE